MHIIIQLKLNEENFIHIFILFVFRSGGKMFHWNQRKCFQNSYVRIIMNGLYLAWLRAKLETVSLKQYKEGHHFWYTRNKVRKIKNFGHLKRKYRRTLTHKRLQSLSEKALIDQYQCYYYIWNFIIRYHIIVYFSFIY